MTEFITISEFMRRFSVSRSTVYRLAERGEIEMVRIGRSVRISRESAENLFRSLTSKSATSGGM